MTATDHTALSDRAVSYLRTIVPTLWGALVVTVLRVMGPHLPGDVGAAFADVLSSELVLTLVVTVAIAAWYWLWRRLERHVPDWLVRLVLGSARTPGYALTPASQTPDGADIVTDAVNVSAPMGYEVAEVTAAKDDVADRLGLEWGGYAESSELDPIAAANDVVERLIAKGWRPTVATAAHSASLPSADDAE